jgi:D-serine deaminase-like pyridoxal phosphate-dependent protein
MVKISQLGTPSFIVDLDIMEKNIVKMAVLCKKYGKQLCPMVKTHKCMEIALLQQHIGGAGGFLAGTLTEAEKMADVGIMNIMLAYPHACKENIRRIAALIKRTHLILCFDGEEAACLTEQILAEENLTVDYVIILDCGLHRLGIEPEKIVFLASALQSNSHLCFKGIASHPGHVYGVSDPAGIADVAAEEIRILEKAKENLMQAGFNVDIVASGCTPTTIYELQSHVVDIIRPGNYIFNDAIQIALGTASEKECSLSVLATIIAHPAEDRYIIDAGSKCLGLDKGAHNISLVKGFGIIKGHPELLMEALSEEVGKIQSIGSTTVKVGDILEIIPNHACVAANMTNYLMGCRHGEVERRLYIDARGGLQ